MVDSSSPPVLPLNVPSSSGWSFTQGFLLGQLSVVVVICFFIKFFIFGEPPSSDSYARSQQRQRAQSFPSSARSASLSEPDGGISPITATIHTKKISSVIRPSPPLTTSAILAKTYYNVHRHQPESVDWFNVLIAQTIAQLRSDAQADNAILSSLTSALNGSHMPDFMGAIRVTEINLGEEFPIFSNCRVIPVSSDGDSSPDGANGGSGTGARLQARMDVDLSDTITLGIETKLILNYPKPLVAVLPVALAVSVVRFSGTLSISFIPSGPPPYTSATPSTSSTRRASHNPRRHHNLANPTSSTSNSPNPADPTPPTSLTFSFLPDYRLELSTHSLLGSRSRLQDVPKIAQLVEARLRMWFDERCVEPRFQQVALPSMWPRKRNTRGGEADAEGEERDGTPRTSPRKKDRERDRDGSWTQLPSASVAATSTSHSRIDKSPSALTAATTAGAMEGSSGSLNTRQSHRIQSPNAPTEHLGRDYYNRASSHDGSEKDTHEGSHDHRQMEKRQADTRNGSDRFVSGRELEAQLHLRHPHSQSRSPARSLSRDDFRMPGSMPT